MATTAAEQRLSRSRPRDATTGLQLGLPSPPIRRRSSLSSCGFAGMLARAPLVPTKTAPSTSLSPIGSSMVAKPRKLRLAIDFRETSRIRGHWGAVRGEGHLQSRHDGGRLRSGGRSWRADRANRQWRKAITAGDGKCRGIHHGKGDESTLNFAPTRPCRISSSANSPQAAAAMNRFEVPPALTEAKIRPPQLGEYQLSCLSGTRAINRVPLYTALSAGAGRRRIPLEHASPHRPDA
jgi:hypothetical protein